jgi:hypothetical protein
MMARCTHILQGHKEECVVRVVSKEGPNCGRRCDMRITSHIYSQQHAVFCDVFDNNARWLLSIRFYCCARPAGEKGNHLARCDFFQWDEVRLCCIYIDIDSSFILLSGQNPKRRRNEVQSVCFECTRYIKRPNPGLCCPSFHLISVVFFSSEHAANKPSELCIFIISII